MGELENQQISKWRRRKTKDIRSELRGILMKKGYEKGGGSLQGAYRKLIRILDDWYRKGM